MAAATCFSELVANKADSVRYGLDLQFNSCSAWCPSQFVILYFFARRTVSMSLSSWSFNVVHVRVHAYDYLDCIGVAMQIAGGHDTGRYDGKSNNINEV